MRIVYLHHANVCRGGIERMLISRANLLAEQDGYEVTLLTYEQNGEPYPYDLSPKVKCVDMGIRLYTVYKYSLPIRFFLKRLFQHKLSVAIRQYLDDYHPDIVTCTDKAANELNALSSVRRLEKIVIEAHTGMVDHLMQVKRSNILLKRTLAKIDIHRLRLAVSKFDVLVALTPDDSKCWDKYIKTVVIPNYLSYCPTCNADLSYEKKRVIAVGRLDYQKGFDLLLQAWSVIEASYPDWKLDIFGDGEEKNSLSHLMTTLNLHNVTFHPSTPYIYKEFLQSDFLVCSSRWEAFGLVIIEAMSSGIPVISFDCDNGPRNIIIDGVDGVLVKDGDVGDLALKIKLMIENCIVRKKMGNNALMNVSRFKEEIIFNEYIQLYKQLTK